MKTKFFFWAGLLLFSAIFTSCEQEFTLDQPGALVPLTVDQDPGLPAISVNGTHLHSEAFGDPNDPMVIFLHGGPGSDYRNGMKVVNLIYDQYYVVMYDQRGSGLSKRHPKDSYTVDVMFDDLKSVIQYYRTSPDQKVFLFGHSWGAMLAAGYINKYPNDIDGVVLAEPGGFTFQQIEEYGERSRRIKVFKEVANDAIYPDQILTGKENAHEVLDYKIALAWPFTYAEGNEEGIEGPSPFWRNGAAVIKALYEIGDEEGFDFRQNLDEYITPVLFLYSENNRAYGESFAKSVGAPLPHVQYEQVDDTGHEMIYFGWENTYELVLPYLQSLR